MKQLNITLLSFLLLSMISCNKSNIRKAEYSGTDISAHASIVRDKNTKQASLIINEIQGKWALFAGQTVEGIDFSKPIASGEGSGTFPLAVTDTARSYFQFVGDGGQAILSERHLPMTGGYNFRDLGGIKTKDNRYVKWGKVFRSDDLYKLTNEDLRYLKNIPIISIVDFRSVAERDSAPDRNPASVIKNYALSINPGNLSSIEEIVKLPEEGFRNIMTDINCMLVSDSLCVDHYRTFFALLQDEKNIPLMFHCTAGKDRTGMGAALFLYSLGVEESAIFDDYLSSNIYLKDKYAGLVAQYPQMKPLMGVSPEYLKSGLDEIKNKYGSIDSYLTKTLDVNLEKMKELYLY